jgi:hypothetical protein
VKNPVLFDLTCLESAMKAGSSYSLTAGKGALIAGKKRGVTSLEHTAPLTA